MKCLIDEQTTAEYNLSSRLNSNKKQERRRGVARGVVERDFTNLYKPKALLHNAERYRSGHNGPDSKSSELNDGALEKQGTPFSYAQNGESQGCSRIIL